MGDMQMIDCMIKDGLWDAFNGYHMGTTAENVAKQWEINREMQDAFALASQNKAEAAQLAGKFDDEVIPFTVKTRRSETVVDKDEYIRHGATLESLQKLRPAFDREGSVTAGQRLRSQRWRRRCVADVRRKRRQARYSADGPHRVLRHRRPRPLHYGCRPYPCLEKGTRKSGWKASDLDLVEANEAFAAQACAVNKDMDWDPAVVNVNGGAIAIGHPIGASGARILNTLLFEMIRRDAKKGLATLCIGGGMGVALCVERD